MSLYVHKSEGLRVKGEVAASSLHPTIDQREIT